MAARSLRLYVSARRSSGSLWAGEFKTNGHALRPLPPPAAPPSGNTLLPNPSHITCHAAALPLPCACPLPRLASQADLPPDLIPDTRKATVFLCSRNTTTISFTPPLLIQPSASTPRSGPRDPAGTLSLFSGTPK
ncbi:hypothetical protein E2C01_085241 [Portunus trituberculatus]|uniref:Uncharacterized protein n=1 Tax=Portunus trituberculatus TaxID=210409 RepID=A0A5B7J6A7_PORTR|nr:hypothetical protein [Portunus trituberculatus]